MKDPHDTTTVDMYESHDIDLIALDVFQWASAVFPNRTDSSLYLKMYEEFGEVIKSNGDPLEVADLFILLLDYAHRKEISLKDVIYQKLEINKRRHWAIDPNTGTMNHIHPEE